MTIDLTGPFQLSARFLGDIDQRPLSTFSHEEQARAHCDYWWRTSDTLLSTSITDLSSGREIDLCLGIPASMIRTA
jgi:hypothetical protein